MAAGFLWRVEQQAAPQVILDAIRELVEALPPLRPAPIAMMGARSLFDRKQREAGAVVWEAHLKSPVVEPTRSVVGAQSLPASGQTAQVWIEPRLRQRRA